LLVHISFPLDDTGSKYIFFPFFCIYVRLTMLTDKGVNC